MAKLFKVLIVEDELLTAKSLQLELQETGVDVLDPIASGEEAVQIAIHENPSLILMDIRLAGVMDGIEAASEILKTKRIPIIFMTGYATENLKERALKMNIHDYLEKPIDIYKLKQIVDTLKNEWRFNNN